MAVVGGDDTVEVRPVKPAERIGRLWVVDSGLKGGERIVVEGLQKVGPGVKVKPEIVTIEGTSGSPSAVSASAASGAKGTKG